MFPRGSGPGGSPPRYPAPVPDESLSSSSKASIAASIRSSRNSVPRFSAITWASERVPLGRVRGGHAHAGHAVGAEGVHREHRHHGRESIPPDRPNTTRSKPFLSVYSADRCAELRRPPPRPRAARLRAADLARAGVHGEPGQRHRVRRPDGRPLRRTAVRMRRVPRDREPSRHPPSGCDRQTASASSNWARATISPSPVDGERCGRRSPALPCSRPTVLLEEHRLHEDCFGARSNRASARARCPRPEWQGEADRVHRSPRRRTGPRSWWAARLQMSSQTWSTGRS